MSTPVAKRVSRVDSIPMDMTYFTEEGYLIDHPIVTRVGIFVYHNDDGSERRELRIPEEVFAEESLASYEGKPVIITHDAGYVCTENVQQEAVGTILSKGYRDGDTVRAKIVIHDMDSVKKTSARELSLGYDMTLDETPGVFQGEPYDAIQRDIQVNHLAIVDAARAGKMARLNIDSRDKENLTGGNVTMSKETRKDGDPISSSAVEAFKQRRAERLNAGAAGADGGGFPAAAAAPAAPAAAPAPAPEEKKPDNQDSVQCVKDRRGQRDAAGDPADITSAMDVIAQQDEDIDTLLGVIDVLKAAAPALDTADKKDGEDKADCGAKDVKDGKDSKDAEDGGPAGTADRSDRADSAEDFRELLRVVRIGDRLNMDGLETKSVKDAKKAILAKLKPSLRLDGQSDAYINAAFNIATSEMPDRKDTNYQRGQMMSRADGKNPGQASVGGASDARQRMIDRTIKKEDK